MMLPRYHARDAAVIVREQELERQEEIEDTVYEYVYDYGTRQCRPCEEDRPRFFFGTNQEEDMNDVPCCSDDKVDYVEQETYPEQQR